MGIDVERVRKGIAWLEWTYDTDYVLDVVAAAKLAIRPAEDDAFELDRVLVDALRDGIGLNPDLRDRILAAGFSRAAISDAKIYGDMTQADLANMAETHAFCEDRLNIEVDKVKHFNTEYDTATAAMDRVRAVVKQWSPADSYARDEILRALDGEDN